MTCKRLWPLLVFALLTTASVRSAPVTSPLNSPGDPTGQSLQQTMVWADPGPTASAEFVAFRKQFTLAGSPHRATLHLFADVRYLLWINGQSVLRGPARFEPTGPEYDTLDITPFVKEGGNTLAVLVMENGSNGKMRHHAPGLTARVDVDDQPGFLTTDETWKCSAQTRYRRAKVNWGNVMDDIDARVEDGDWTQPAYDDRAWKPVAKIDGAQWGPLSARRIPLLRESEVATKFPAGQTLPVTLTANQTLEFTTDHLVQAYTALEIDADADSELSLDYTGIKYVARAGRQTYVSSDTHGFFGGTVTVKSGRVTIRKLDLIERLYPFEVVGSFKSNDEALNKLWAVCARSCQVCSEDSYVDCADRERTEWMDNDPPGFDITRTAMAGPGPGGGKVYSDPRLLEEMLRRTALTIQPDGWVKAHTCSDRFDVHAKMEDRACDWVQGARRYYESTGNPAVVREIWPVIVRQMNYFLERRSIRGLVLAREWEVWGNPVGYMTCEGAGLNAFIYKALVDAAALGRAIGETRQAADFDAAATALATAFNEVLWNEKEGTYFSGYTDDYEKAQGKRRSSIPLEEGNLLASTMFPALFALEEGIVPAARHERVASYLFAHNGEAFKVMTFYYLFNQLYQADTPAFDRQVLQTMREQWRAMVASPWQTSWEDLHGGSKAHIYGMFPGAFLSSHVLGVRLDGPADSKKLLIEPRLGDLTSAEGVVVTEHGPVPVSWTLADGKLAFQVEIPAGVSATLRVPRTGDTASLTLDGKLQTDPAQGRYFVAKVGPGKHGGEVASP